jgi:predicted Co/Zn/Cd cation transporter (cation efflux family)
VVAWRVLPIVLAVIAVIFLAVAIVYFVTPAGSLPSFAPGYTAGGAHIHVKHGIVAIVVMVVFAVGAWFSTAKWSAAKQQA